MQDPIMHYNHAYRVIVSISNPASIITLALPMYDNNNNNNNNNKNKARERTIKVSFEKIIRKH